MVTSAMMSSKLSSLIPPQERMISSAAMAAIRLISQETMPPTP